jgi:hypothetical protein
MVVEKQTDDSNLPDIEIQSGLLITTKERVKNRNVERNNSAFILGWNIYFFQFC